MRETGNGASGRNGGFCNASLTHGFVNGYTRFPDEMAVIEKLGRENLDAMEETIKRYKIDCDFERNGELRMAVAPWQMAGLKEEAIQINEERNLEKCIFLKEKSSLSLRRAVK